MSRLLTSDISQERVKLYTSGTVLVSDSFTGTNGTAIDSHTPETALNSAVWVDDGTEALVINNNQMSSENVTGTSNCFSYIDTGNTNLTVVANVDKNASDLFSRLDVIVRYQNKLNYVGLTFKTFPTARVSISKIVNGVDVELVVLDTDAGNAGKSAEVTIVSTSTTLTATVVYEDDTTKTGNVSSSLMNNATKAGIFCSHDDMLINDFLVTKT